MEKERNNEPIVNSSSSASIALLRERFKHLQRQKEMRQERDHLRFVNKVTNQVSGHPPSARSVVHQERRLFLSCAAPSPRLSLSLGLSDAGVDLRSGNFVVTRLASSALRTDPFDDDHDEVDTSLHL